MWAMIAFAVKGSMSNQTDSVNPRAPDIQENTFREMISVIVICWSRLVCRLIIAKPLSELIQTYN